jgi:transposase
VCLADGRVITEKVIETKADVLRREVGAVEGPKRVVFENGPLSGLIMDAVRDVAEEVISCDATRNALISRSDDSNDRNDARRLGTLARNGSIYPVYVPAEPYRSLRQVVGYELHLTRTISVCMVHIKALCRSRGVPCRGKTVYARRERPEILARMGSGMPGEHLGSLYRLLDGVRRERLVLRRKMGSLCEEMSVYRRVQTIPGIGPVVARTLVAWIVDPGRFKSRSALSTYAGLGLKYDTSNWRPTQRPRASKRGQRQVKRVLFLAARAVVRMRENAFAKRYSARRAAGWEDRKAIRDIARQLLFSACHVWRTGEEYDDARINVPVIPGAR